MERLPIGSLDECKASTGFLEAYYPGFEFKYKEKRKGFPKGCYVFLGSTPAWGFFNTYHHDAGHKRCKALCGQKLQPKGSTFR